ncbi:VOC family protein [Owenweeksia hongkongensis]|uniref:VOC family protein n=1 Tax=Owenweeksia hongkongensis TaxID=253245 RepID=UPI003A939BBE
MTKYCESKLTITLYSSEQIGLNSYELLKARGAKFVTPPSTNGAETRCFFHDPDRHLFEISEYRR